MTVKMFRRVYFIKKLEDRLSDSVDCKSYLTLSRSDNVLVFEKQPIDEVDKVIRLSKFRTLKKQSFAIQALFLMI